MRGHVVLCAAVLVGLAFVSAAAGAQHGFLERPPYVGLLCGKGYPACRTIGIAVWPTHRPLLLTGTIRSRTVRFTEPPADTRARDYWEVFVPRHDLKVGGAVVIALKARYADGRSESLTIQVRLAPGWG
jgi:hypothetical protein